MIYLTGSTNDTDEPQLIRHGIGLVVGPSNSYYLRADRYPWLGYDLGMALSDADDWLAFLDRLPRDRVLYAVSPDVYPDAAASLERGRRYAGIIRDMGFPVAIVAQDGAEHLAWPWDDFDVLFIGGERRRCGEWKLSAEAESLIREARRHGKWVHMGRVNSLRRMERARLMGCLSADGTFLKYRRRNRSGEPPLERDRRGAVELREWGSWLAAHRPFPQMLANETPELLLHRQALAAFDHLTERP